MEYLIYLFLIFLFCSFNFTDFYLKKVSKNGQKTWSSHIGSSYVWKNHSKLASLIIFCGDSILKGFFPIFVAKQIMDFDAVIPASVFTNNEMYLIPIVLIQIIANNWSIFLKFKGGRGMAVIIGIILGLNPFPLAICLYVIYIIAWTKIRDGGPSWIIALIATTLISIPISNVISICLLACILLTLLKRILGNSITKKYTIIKNRLIFDRDY